jgi:hypothetical protein
MLSPLWMSPKAELKLHDPSVTTSCTAQSACNPYPLAIGAAACGAGALVVSL